MGGELWKYVGLGGRAGGGKKKVGVATMWRGKTSIEGKAGNDDGREGRETATGVQKLARRAEIGRGMVMGD